MKEESNETNIENNESEIPNRTERLSKKTITCPKCDKSMLLRSFRYNHEKNCQGHLENRKTKPQAKPKPKLKPVTIQPKAIESPNAPTYLLEAKQKSIIQEQRIKSPQELFMTVINRSIKNRLTKERKSKITYALIRSLVIWEVSENNLK